MQMQARFPVDTSGNVILVLANLATNPITYCSGLRFDATGAVVIFSAVPVAPSIQSDAGLLLQTDAGVQITTDS